jgi:hypothetical protein
MRERERAVISQIVPVCECLGMGVGESGNGGLLGRKEGGWKDEEVGVVKEGLPRGFKGRVALRKKWDTEWGRIGKEGNLWWWIQFHMSPNHLTDVSFSPQARLRPCQLGCCHGEEPVDLVL